MDGSYGPSLQQNKIHIILVHTDCPNQTALKSSIQVLQSANKISNKRHIGFECTFERTWVLHGFCDRNDLDFHHFQRGWVVLYLYFSITMYL
jgi:hypothetical protein